MAAAVAEKFNVAKGDLLDPESSNLAVRMALAETQVIQETITFFEKACSPLLIASSFTYRQSTGRCQH